MSSGGSNYSTGMTGGGNQVRIDSPASQQNGYGSAPAPGGKGGFPSAQNPYQQQASVYMPPSQPSFYQQAFTQPRMEPPPRQYGLGGMGGGNAYARPAVMPDRRYPVGPTPTMPGLMPDTYPTRRAAPVDYSDMRIDSFGPPVEATRGVVPEPNYSGGLGSLMGGMNDSVSYSLKPPPSGFGPLQQQNPQLLAQMQGAEFENQRKAADLQRLRSQPYDPRQLIG